MSESSKWILADVLSASESSCILKLLHLLLKSVSHIHCCAVPVLEHQGSAESVWCCKSWTLTSASLAPRIVVVAQCGFCLLVRIILIIQPDTGKCMEHWSCWLTFFWFLWPLLRLVKELQVQNSPQMTCALMLRCFSGQWLNVVKAECVGVDVESWERFLSSMQLIIFACYTFKVSFAHPAEKSVLHFWLSQP